MHLNDFFPLGVSATCNHSKYRSFETSGGHLFGVLLALYTKRRLNECVEK